MQGAQRELWNLSRAEGNNQCVDCGSANPEWVSISWGCFLCVTCAGIHRSLGVQTSRVMSIRYDTWTDDQVEFIKRNGNRHVNQVYERYIPSGMTKPRPDTDATKRTEWIKAKYENRLFATPQTQNTSKNEKQNVYEIPNRLIEYFTSIDAGPLIDSVNISSTKMPEELVFQPIIQSIFPSWQTEQTQNIVPDLFPQFCFPRGICLVTRAQSPRFHPFVLTDLHGIKLFAACLIMDEPLSAADLVDIIASHSSGSGFPSWLASSNKHKSRTISIYRPKAICLVSHYPFWDVFCSFLQQIFRILLSHSPLPIERFIGHIVTEVPLPPKGLIQVEVTVADAMLSISRPPPNMLPMANFSLELLFRSLDLENILTIFSAVLVETKVVFCSSRSTLLTLSQEAIMTLIFPFVWQGAYIPVLPSGMEGILDAPVPVMIGLLLPRDQNEAERVLALVPDDVLLVDLDRGQVSLSSSIAPPPPLPVAEVGKLIKQLREKVQSRDLVSKRTNSRTGMTSEISISIPIDQELDGLQSAFSSEENIAPVTSFGFEDGLINTSRSSNKSLNRPMIGSKYWGVSEVSIQSTFDQNGVRAAFLRFFVSVLRNYRNFLHIKTDSSSRHLQEFVFDADEFLQERDPKDRQFLTDFVESQMFQHFLEASALHPDDHTVRFFDESIAAKKNRNPMYCAPKDLLKF